MPQGTPTDPVILDASARPLPRPTEINLTATTFSGPLPPPQMLADYDKISPGLANRMMAQVELQSEHRREIEKTVVQGNVRSSKRGTVAGVIVALGAMALAAYALQTNHPTAAVAIVSIDLASLVGVFVLGRNATPPKPATPPAPKPK